MKKPSLLLAFISLVSFANAQWQQTSLNSSDVLCFATKGDTTFAGTTDGMYLSSNNGNTWVAVNTGLTHDTVGALAISGIHIFAGTENGGVYLSSNNGGLWTAVNTGLPSRTSILALDIKMDTVFAGTYGSGVYLSLNNGSSWDSVNTGLPSNSYAYALAIKGDTIFAGIYGIGAFISSNNGSSWVADDAGLTSNISCFNISGNNIFAGGDQGVFLSSIHVPLWTDESNGIPSNPNVTSLAINGNYIFAGTDGGGVFMSSNYGSNWAAWNAGFTDTYIMSLAISGTNIYAGTGMNGVWKRSLSGLGIEEINNASNIKVYPNPTSNNLIIEFPLEAIIEITNIQGQLVKTIAATGNKTNIDVSALPSGVYVVQVKSEKVYKVGKFVKE